jgi:nucleoside-diphosphate-sugar epimerase
LARTVLGWQPEMELTAGLERTVAWFVEARGRAEG